MARALLAARASVTVRNVQGWSALDFALWAHAEPCANLLRSQGAPAMPHAMLTPDLITSVRHPAPPHADLYAGWPDIAVAAARNSPQLVLAALRHGASAGARTPDGASVLTIAAQSGAVDSLKVLLAARGHHEGSASRGSAALIAAIRSGRQDAVAALLASGVSPDRSSTETVAPLLDRKSVV